MIIVSHSQPSIGSSLILKLLSILSMPFLYLVPLWLLVVLLRDSGVAFTIRPYRDCQLQKESSAWSCHRFTVLWLAVAQLSSRHNISLVAQRNVSLSFVQQIPYFLNVRPFRVYPVFLWFICTHTPVLKVELNQSTVLLLDTIFPEPL